MKTLKNNLVTVAIASIIMLIMAVVGYFYFQTANHAQVLHDAQHHGTGILGIKNWETKEGLRVYYMPSEELPMVDIQLAVDAGSARDTNLLGLAHLTNVLLTQGSLLNPTETFLQKIEHVGAQFSNETRRDVAVLNLRSLTQPRYLDPAIHLFTEVLEKPLFDEANVSREKQQTLSEIESLFESPDEVAKHSFFITIYKNHPYANPVLGEQETVKNISPNNVAEFYKNHYNPQNAVLAIVGNVSEEKAHDIAAAVSNAMPFGPKAEKLPPVSLLRQAIDLHVTFPSTQTHIMQGAPTLKRSDPDYFNLYIGNHILGGGSLVSLLFDKVREKRGLVYDVHSYFLPLREEGPFIIGLQTRNEEVNQALTVVAETLQDFLKNGPTDEELDAAKKNITGSFNLQFSSNRTIAAQLAMLGYYDLPLNYFETFNANINAVTAKQVHDAFVKHVDPQNFATVMVGPASVE